MSERSTRPRTKVLVTGAGGYMAARLLPELARDYDLRLVDVRDVTAEYDIADVHTADLASPNRDGYGHLFADVEVVVHLGYIRSSPRGVYDQTIPHIDRFEAEMANVQMAYNVYRVALDAGVRRVVVASSNHAADWYEHALVHSGRRENVTPSDLPLSDNFYGWSKAAYELMAFPFACGTFGRSLEVVLLRIGAPRDVDAADHIGRETGTQPSIPGGVAGLKRDLGAYLSRADGVQLFTRAIETEDIRDEHGVPWLIAYGISDNTRAFWSLETAKRVLGYEPQDDGDIRFADQVGRWITNPGDPRPGKLG
ncbi:MAG TPA: NAD(P)-dependent oxidoreductase [Acidimicrobiia bacterium]|nr:NAD(P)-dependent oxidoreductase [Acidimicrobiia bacterium]